MPSLGGSGGVKTVAPSCLHLHLPTVCTSGGIFCGDRTCPHPCLCLPLVRPAHGSVSGRRFIASTRGSSLCAPAFLFSALGSNASGFAAVAFSAMLAGLTLAVPLVGAYAAFIASCTPHLCASTVARSTTSAGFAAMQASPGRAPPGSCNTTATQPCDSCSADPTPPASLQGSSMGSGGFKHLGQGSTACRLEAVPLPCTMPCTSVSGGNRMGFKGENESALRGQGVGMLLTPHRQ
jgi:hypothetical protein